MFSESIKSVFLRDLAVLRSEIEKYQTEANLWKLAPGTLNSAGNLCLHLVGNLNAYIGVGLAKTDYIRSSDLEFSSKDIPRSKLVEMIDDTLRVLATGIDNVTDDMIGEPFPIKIWEEQTNIGYTLIRLAGHLNYHLGQVNYHRRIVEAS